MTAIVNFLLEISEAMFINMAMSAIKNEIPYVIEKIDKINPAVPMRYRLTLDMSRIVLPK